MQSDQDQNDNETSERTIADEISVEYMKTNNEARLSDGIPALENNPEMDAMFTRMTLLRLQHGDVFTIPDFQLVSGSIVLNPNVSFPKRACQSETFAVRCTTMIFSRVMYRPNASMTARQH